MATAKITVMIVPRSWWRWFGLGGAAVCYAGLKLGLPVSWFFAAEVRPQ